MLKWLKFVTIFLISFSLFPLMAKADSASGTIFSITKTVAPSTASISSVIAYSITIKNISASNEGPLTITDTLPTGFSYSGNSLLTKIDGTQVTFTPQISGQTLNWTFDGDTLQSIPPDQTVVISYQVTAGSTIGDFVNNVCLTTPENVCTQATVTIATNPNTGILDNIGLGIISGIALIIIASKLRYSKNSFESRLMNKKQTD